MMTRKFLMGAIPFACAAAALVAAVPASAQISVAQGVNAGELDVPVNKSQVIRSDRPYSKALIGNPDIADVLPLTSNSLYVLGKKMGTTSLTLYDRTGHLIAVMDVDVGPDVIGLRRQLSELMPNSTIGARISNDSIVLEGVVPDAPTADRAVQLAETYAPSKVVNLLSIGSAQQVMLDVRFAEVKRSAMKQLGLNWSIMSCRSANPCGNLNSVIGNGSSLTPKSSSDATGQFLNGAITGSFGIISRAFRAFGQNFNVTLDALEERGAVTTLAEPTLVALSGQTASFLAGGEFPVPVSQGNGGTGGGGTAITVEWKPFGVSLAFTPTVLADGVINMEVAPEVSSIDPSASITINNLTIPGLQTRRAKSVVEMHDGESFALAGLIRKDFSDTVRQVPLLGSLPIIGTLFRSTGFQHDETELVIIVTPHLVRPVPEQAMKLPTDLAAPPHEADLFLNGHTDAGVPPVGGFPGAAAPTPVPPPPPPPPAPAPGAGGSAERGPTGFEKDYGHVL
jgi:pilus assembly protein CpaC